MKKNLWWTAEQTMIRFCFVCGGGLAPRFVPIDKKKRLVCKICLHITYNNPKSVAGLIPVASDGRIALLKREMDPAKGKWSYPAGFQEWGETIAEAAVRETKEEICVRTRTTKLLGVYSYENSGVLTTVFIGRLLKGETPKAGHEALEVQLFKPKQIPWKELAFRSTVDALKDYVVALAKL